MKRKGVSASGRIGARPKLEHCAVSPKPRYAGSPARPLVVFCDFDGTIAEQELILQIFERFCPPGWETIARAVGERRKPVGEGIAELCGLIPSSKKDEIIAFAKGAIRFRDGFLEFLKFCRPNGLQFNVCSGGVDFFIQPILEPYTEYIDHIYSMAANLSGDRIRLQTTDSCDTCGLCKAKVMARHPGTIRILIGDGVTDVHGAREASLVFARGKLRGYLDQDGIPYQSFESFHDIIGALSRFQGKPHEDQVGC
ncbi:MAG TPA: MtnX-like HAD-IB family phosphatase [Elusimicrobiota bacterium]|nr:MtnX-like HAD-IB family phosphatase [Elusimicrobiota bacterium]